MKIRLLLFGAAARTCGAVLGDFEIPDRTAAGDVSAILRTRCGSADSLDGPFAIAVNRTYVRPEHVLSEGDEVALIPPVSGG